MTENIISGFFYFVSYVQLSIAPFRWGNHQLSHRSHN